MYEALKEQIVERLRRACSGAEAAEQLEEHLQLVAADVARRQARRAAAVPASRGLGHDEEAPA